MAISTTDGIVAGLMQSQNYVKSLYTSGTPPASGIRGYTDWYLGGSPAASTATSVGINGEAVTPALGSVASRILRVNPSSGQAYLARFAAKRGSNSVGATNPGMLLLVDRLWQNSGLSATLTTAQAITPATLPARDRAGSTNGDGVLAAIEWSVSAGTGAPTVTLTYTNQAGATGQTAALTGTASTGAVSWEIFPLASGDTGIRAPTSFIQSATRTSGTMQLVLFRVLAAISLDTANQPGIADAISLAMPRIYDDSVLQLVFIPGASISGGLSAQYLETQG